jgi:hypothetical protein
MVGGAVAHPAASSEPDMKLSLHPAPQMTGSCYTAPAVGAGVSTLSAGRHRDSDRVEASSCRVVARPLTQYH